jgi:hypothetical protein
LQQTDYYDAFNYAITLSGVDPERMVYWGTSFSGGNVIYRTNKLYSASSRFVTAARTIVPLTRVSVTKIGVLRGPSFQKLTAAALVEAANRLTEAIESFMI